MADKDPYTVLGVHSNASDAEIKRAYRKLARQYHPDRNSGNSAAESKFKDIQAAYEKIENAEARAEYDQQQQMANMFGGGFGGGGQGARFRMDGANMGGFQDVFSSMFGGGSPSFGGAQQQPFGQRRQRTTQKGAPINVGLEISKEDAEKGGDFPFSFKRFKSNGGSMETKKVTLKLKLKPGVSHGDKKTLKGQGHDHPEGETGDVVVTIRIDPGEHRFWDGDILVQHVEVPYSTLVLGGKISTKLPSGKSVRLNVEAHSQSGDRRRINKEGFNGGPLDIEFILPDMDETQLSKEQRKALERLRELGL